MLWRVKTYLNFVVSGVLVALMNYRHAKSWK